MRTRALASAVLLTSPVVAQTLGWHRLPAISGESCAAAFDEARGRIVLFEGARADGNGRTWERVGRAWTLRRSARGPSERAGPAMTYDSLRRRVVLYGGGVSTGQLADTWEWDGVEWVNPTPANNPGARSFAPMAFDHVSARVLLYGGALLRFDTWGWDGQNWTLLVPNGPQMNSGPAMASDATRRRVTLFGMDNTLISATWEWDGSAWTLQQPAVQPPPRRFHRMTYVPHRQRTLLHGGVVGTFFGITALGDTWEWDGTNWSPAATAGPMRMLQAFAHDPVSGNTVLVGGAPVSLNPAWESDTWEWDGTSWQQRTATGSGHGIAAACFDVARARLVAITDALQTLESDGVRWYSVAASPQTLTPASGFTSLGYDAARARVVLVDVGSSGPSTWEWDGTTWSAVTAAPGLGPLAWHAGRNRVVLFTSGAGSGLHEWNGGSWTALPSAAPAPASASAAMAYDSRRDRVVLCNAVATSPGLPVVSVFEWDGATWRPANATISPPPRASFALAYDTVRERVVLFGGRHGPSGSSQFRGDLWEWDGAVWSERVLAPQPHPRTRSLLVADPNASRLLLLGGTVGETNSNSFVRFGDLWELTATPSFSATVLGPGCGGASVPPRLVASVVHPGGPCTIDLLGAPPGAPVLFVVGLSGASSPGWGPCTLFLPSSAELAFAVANAAGFASIRGSIPRQAVGETVFAQAVALDLQSPLGLAFPGALRFVTGF